MVSNADVRGDTRCARRNCRNAHPNTVGWLSCVEVDVLPVRVDGFAGIQLKPVAAAVEIRLERQCEVGAAGHSGSKSELTAIGVDLESVVNR